MLDDQTYSTWKDVSVMADCLRDLKMTNLANDLLKNHSKAGTIDKYLTIILNAAYEERHVDVLDRLHFAGLIYS